MRKFYTNFYILQPKYGHFRRFIAPWSFIVLTATCILKVKNVKKWFSAKIIKNNHFPKPVKNRLPGALIPKSPESVPRLLEGYFGNVVILCNFRSRHFFRVFSQSARISLWLMIFTLSSVSRPIESVRKKGKISEKGKIWRLPTSKRHQRETWFILFEFFLFFSRNFEIWNFDKM